MLRPFSALAVMICLAASATGQTEEKKPLGKPLPPELAQLLQLSPEEFVKRFDMNKDGALSKDEMPPFFARAFERGADANGDGKLDRTEVAAMLTRMRGFMAQPQNAPTDVEKFVTSVLDRQDENKDGKISRAEAKDRLAGMFDQVDTNKDGFVDRAELRVLAQRMVVGQKGPGPLEAKAGPDFDSFDKNADGRLTPEELRGTPFFAAFAEIDADASGQVDRREFERYLKRQK
jgi:Ca2+-binding EF-hand superfamily protein